MPCISKAPDTSTQPKANSSHFTFSNTQKRRKRSGNIPRKCPSCRLTAAKTLFLSSEAHTTWLRSPTRESYTPVIIISRRANILMTRTPELESRDHKALPLAGPILVTRLQRCISFLHRRPWHQSHDDPPPLADLVPQAIDHS